MKHHSWRSALAVPAVVSIAFGGALLAAGPALAAPAEPAISAATPAVTDPTTTTPAADPTTTTPAADPTTTTPAADPTTSTATPTPTQTTSTPTPTSTSTSTPTPTSTATAAASSFAVSTPADGVPVTTTTPVFTGTGVAGSTVEIQYIGADKDVHTAGTATVTDAGTWTITTSFADLGPGITKAVLTVADVDSAGNPVQGAEPVIRLLTFTAPPVQAQGQSIVLTPDYPTVDGAATDGIGVATTGFTAGEALTVTVTGPGGKPAVWEGSVTTPVADGTGAFNDLIALPDTAPGGTYVVTVTGATSHLVLSKSAFVLGDPTITSPTAGEKIIGTSVTFTGTGTPGSSIGLVIAPTSEFDAAQATTSTDKTAQLKSPRAAATDPGADNENIAVGSTGKWSVTVAIAKPGDYTAVAVAGVVDANGDPVSDNTGLPVLSGPSDDVAFVLAAAPVVTTSSTGGTTTLAFTGSNAAPYVIGGGLAVLLGVGLMVATRRRRDETAE